MKGVLLVYLGSPKIPTAKDVNKFGLKICCDTVSHFNATFKRKFGTTSNKYLMDINPSN